MEEIAKDFTFKLTEEQLAEFHKIEKEYNDERRKAEAKEILADRFYYQEFSKIMDDETLDDDTKSTTIALLRIKYFSMYGAVNPKYMWEM